MQRLRIVAPFYGAVLILGVCASIFIPPLYSGKLGDWLSLSSTESSFFFAVLDAFAFFTIPAGIVIDRFGFRSAGVLAAIFTFVGYMLLFATVKQPHVIPTLFAFIAAAICGQGSVFAVMTSLKVIAATVAVLDRGKAIGLCMALFGLSGGFYTAMFELFLNGNAQVSLFLFCGGSMSLLMLISSLLLKPDAIGPTAPKADKKSSNMNAMLVYCIIATVLVCSLSFTTGVMLKAIAAVLVGSLVVLACLALGLGLMLRINSSQDHPGLLAHTNCSPGLHTNGSGNAYGAQDGAELRTALHEARYWLLWYQFAILVGAGMSMINLLAVIVTTAQSSQTSQQNLKKGGTAWFSVGNVMSRFILGYLSDILLALLERTSFMTMASGLMAVAMVLVSVADAATSVIFVPCFFAGFAFGMPWILVPAIEIDWYGHKNFSNIHGVMMLAAVVGVLAVFNALSIITKNEENRDPHLLTWYALAILSMCGFLGGIVARVRRAPRIQCN